MPVRTRLLILCLILTPALLLAQTNRTHEDVTVVQRDGWSHQHVSVTLTDDGTGVIIVRNDGAHLTLPVGDVAIIRDAQGYDITSVVIPGAETDKQSTYDEFGTPVSGSGNTMVTMKPPSSPMLFKFMPSVGVGYGSPTGDFYAETEAGMSYEASVRIAMAPDRYFKISYRSIRIYDESLAVTDYDGNYLGDVDVTMDVRQYLIAIGFMSRHNGKNSLRAYGEIGGGWADHVVTASAMGESESLNEGRVSLFGQMGVLVPFGARGPGLDMGVSVLFKLIEDYDGEGGGAIIGGHIGLMMPFGGSD